MPTSINKKILKYFLCVLFIFNGTLTFAADNPITKVNKLRSKIDDLTSAQVFDELMKLKKTIHQDFEKHKKLKKTTLDEVGIMFDLQLILSNIDANPKKKIDCDKLKNYLLLEYKEEWSELPEGVDLMWPLVEKCCK